MFRAFPFGGGLTALLASIPLTAGAATANLGFEAGPPGPTAPGWTFDAVDGAAVTAGDGPADYLVYQDFAIQVPALFGAQSLRLGTPKEVNESQNRGANSALSDPFDAAGGEILVSFRLLSLEHRGDDRLRFEVLDEFYTPIDGVAYAFEPQPQRPAQAVPLESMTSGCGAGPGCDLLIDIGSRDKRPADTGPYSLTITLPAAAAGSPVRLRYSVIGGENEAHASWAYFDNINRPPQPILRVNPGADAGNPALEGDFVVADCLQSRDPDGDAVACEWVAEGGGLDLPQHASGSVAIFWFPDDGTAQITLTTTDGLGAAANATAPVFLLNAAPAVNAVNLEVLDGTSGSTVCRFADPGIGSAGSAETHYYVGSGSVIGSDEENSPSFSSGFFELAVDAAGTCSVQDKDFDVGSDGYLVRSVDPATLPTRLGDATRNGGVGGNDTTDSAHVLEVDWKYLGAISDPTDIDVFELRRNGSPLPAGSEVVVSLEGLPADYDLLIFSDGGSTEASPFFNAPFFNAPFFNAPFFNAPFFNAPFLNAQFDTVPFFNAPFFNAPFFNAPFFNAPVKKSPFLNAAGEFNRAFSDLPLSEVGLAAPTGSNVSSSDISVAEVGSLSLRALQATPGLSLKAISAEPGTAAEKVLVTVAPGETALYVVVAGNQLAFSATRPYALTLEASTPPSQAALLAGTGFCAAERADPEDPNSPPKFAATWSAAGDPVPTSGQMLILTQRERFETEQAATAEATVAAGDAVSIAGFWTDFWARIDAYAAQFGGRVVSVDGGLFETADRNPCSVAARNQLAQAIRDTYVIAPASTTTPARLRNPGLESVVIVGGQNVIPLFAVPDETVVGNERDYTTDLWVRPGTPLAVAAAEGYNLTDAPYVDVEPTPFRGRELFLEDLPVARLVENPTTIGADLDAFLRGSDNFGRLAMGYDFFCDGTAEVAAILGVEAINGPPCTSQTPWSAQTMRDEWLAGGSGMCLVADAPPPLELAVVNAHMTTYAALSAIGFESGIVDLPPGFDDTVGSAESAQCLVGSTTATIGCHSGLNVPDGWAVPLELGLPFDAARDWVEAEGNLLAPRGYGLGDNTVSNRGTEGLLTLVFEELADGRNIGQALVAAKRRYVMGLRELDVHDEDSLINLALFGPPQLTFDLALPFDAVSAAASTPYGTLGLKLVEGNGDGTDTYLLGSPTAAEPFDLLAREDFDRGTWFELNPGDAQATYGRPLLPVTLPVEDRPVAAGETRIHGIALVSRDAAVNPCPIDGLPRDCVITARFDDLEDTDADGLFDFDPVLPLPQHDWVVPEPGAEIAEPQTCVESLVPTQLGVASTLEDARGVRQSVVIGAGQFRCEAEESRAAGTVVGQHRLYTELQLAALHPVGGSDSERMMRDADFDPPQVLQQTVIANAEDNSVTATVQATDALTGGSGISEIIALVYWEGAATSLGSGAVESYSIKPDGALTEEPFGHTFVLENARNQRLAFQYVDGAGNLTQKSLKGSLFTALDVDILTTLVSVAGSDGISVLVGDYCELEAPSIAYQLDGGEPVVFNVDDPPPGVTVTIEAVNGAPCDRILIIDGLDFSSVASDTFSLTVEIRAIGAQGSDTAIIAACSDPDEAAVADQADILACAFRTENSEVLIDMFLAGAVDADVQYRVDLPDFGGQFKYFKNGRTTSPGGTQLRVDVLSNSADGSQLRFRMGNLDNLGWDGVSPLRFQQMTQTGEPGAPGQGFPDETAVFTGTP